ncbi:endonuclease domain-containing protein [Micropruina sp.]|uniref:endonuclease domain-containing protein n=1 Tax=Micropruina sp. TaxID=2737536 RepID=UPI0039E378CF
MPDPDEMLTLVFVMKHNNGVLRQRDHLRSRAAFDELVRTRTIVRVLPGTYVDADLRLDRSTRFAAALAFATGSVLWGASAVQALTGALQHEFGEGEEVVLAHQHSRRATSGLRWVRRRVPPQQRVTVRGLRCPSPAFVAVEAAVRDDGELIEQFLRAGRLQVSELPDAVAAMAGSPGQDVRRRVVRASLDNPWSGGERVLQALLRRHRIGGWVANAELIVGETRYYPDLCWVEQHLIVEFDGFEVHSRRAVFETDRVRQNALVLAGYRVLRFTWRQVTEQPDAVIQTIQAALARETAPHS